MKRAFVTASAGFCLLLPSAVAQDRPNVSYGSLLAAISADDCATSARDVLGAEGFQIANSGGGGTSTSFFNAFRSVHNAVVFCSPAPDGNMAINVAVASGSGSATNVANEVLDSLRGRLRGKQTSAVQSAYAAGLANPAPPPGTGLAVNPATPAYPAQAAPVYPNQPAQANYPQPVSAQGNFPLPAATNYPAAQPNYPQQQNYPQPASPQGNFPLPAATNYPATQPNYPQQQNYPNFPTPPAVGLPPNYPVQTAAGLPAGYPAANGFPGQPAQGTLPAFGNQYGTGMLLNANWTDTHKGDYAPAAPVLGGMQTDGRRIGVCRVLQNGDWIPGKTALANNPATLSACEIVSEAKEVDAENFQVLTGTYDERLWADTRASGTTFYPGQEGKNKVRSCRYNLVIGGSGSGTQIGKEINGRCWVAYAGKTYFNETYDVLYSAR